ncbi:hypothetical protein CI807_27110 [Pseudomonas sp. NS1(2017)]|uniref:hypothetical protein n=1 Tax=Pseudomonas sp. NS1(2017) TaxID=2025658 RepID=UPI000BA27104|nr:hypothetical protein [Pseudomonas sp. NS1(2017)]ASV39724.1 hypothetical protein CI807_27110 [Pseudomonas sp. NS1(2017)]
MSNIATKQFTPMNTNYAQLNQPSLQADKSLELSPSMDSMNKFLKGSSPAPNENSVPMNKESLERLFAMFEFAIKAMRSMLAGMGVFPRQPGERGAQPQVKPGLDTKTVPDLKAEHKFAPGTDTKTTVLPGTDEKVVPVAPEADTKALVNPGPAVKVMPDGRTQVTTSHDGKLDAQPARLSLSPMDYKHKLSSDINVTVQVQNCHCPHTDEKVAPQPPQPPVTPGLDKQPSPQPPVTPALDKQPSPQPPVTPALDKQPSPQPPMTPALDKQPSPQPPVTPPTPDVTSPAPDDLVDDFSSHSQTRFDNHRADRASPRARF